MEFQFNSSPIQWAAQFYGNSCMEIQRHLYSQCCILQGNFGCLRSLGLRGHFSTCPSVSLSSLLAICVVCIIYIYICNCLLKEIEILRIMHTSFSLGHSKLYNCCVYMQVARCLPPKSSYE